MKEQEFKDGLYINQKLSMLSDSERKKVFSDVVDKLKAEHKDLRRDCGWFQVVRSQAIKLRRYMFEKTGI